LLVFPELSLTGYVLQDLVPTIALRPGADNPIFRRLLDASHKMDLVVGFAEEDQRNRFLFLRRIFQKVRLFTFTARYTCQPMVCSMKGASLPGAIMFRLLTPALAEWEF